MDKKLLEKVAKEKQIVSAIKSGNLGGLYFIFGNENQLKLHYANEIAKKSVDENFADFNLRKYDGTTVSIETLKDAVEALPVFGKGTCVLISDLPINNLKKIDYENLKSVLGNIPKTCSFILLMDTVEKKKSKDKENGQADESKNQGETSEKKIDAWDEILEIAIKDGLAIELNNRPAASLAGQLVRKAADKGYALDENTAFYLVESVGSDIANLNSELDKLCGYVKGFIITVNDIDAVAVKTIEARTYDMIDSLIAGNSRSAYQILDILFAQKVEPLMIVGALIYPFMDMYRVKTAVQSGCRPDDLACYFPCYDSKNRLNNAAGNVRKLSLFQICRCLDLLDDADVKLKTSAIEKRTVIEQTMTGIMFALRNNHV